MDAFLVKRLGKFQVWGVHPSGDVAELYAEAPTEPAAKRLLKLVEGQNKPETPRNNGTKKTAKTKKKTTTKLGRKKATAPARKSGRKKTTGRKAPPVKVASPTAPSADRVREILGKK